MFQKFEYTYFSDENCEIKLVDSDFVVDSTTNLSSHIAFAETSLIIKVYSEKQLDVAKNLFLFIIWLANGRAQYLVKDQFLEIDHIINNLNNKVPNFKDYLPDIRKYLLFT